MATFRTGMVNGGKPVFIGSADWMPRNLDHRIEVYVPVLDRDLKAETRMIVEYGMNNDKKCVIIGSGGNINKLYRLVPKKSKLKERITLGQLEKLYAQLSALSIEDRIGEFELRPDRADVIVPAAKIFISITSAIGAEDIVVPTIGLADGIINDLALNYYCKTGKD